jgi:hypothetical protein
MTAFRVKAIEPLSGSFIFHGMSPLCVVVLGQKSPRTTFKDSKKDSLYNNTLADYERLKEG